MANVVKTDRKVVDGLGWVDFRVFDNGEVEATHYKGKAVYFKPTHTLAGKPMASSHWMNKRNVLYAPTEPLQRALDSL